MTITIYHNPRCSKSRATLALLEEAGHTPTIVEYLNVAPSAAELKSVLEQLGMSARDLMRKGESVYKEKSLSDKNLTEGDLIAAMIADPILIERPIVLNGGKARIGRPPESVLEII
jgi:arsenate reductase